MIHNGISEDLAFQLDDVHRTAFAIVFSNFQRPEDLQFDWSSFTFPDLPK